MDGISLIGGIGGVWDIIKTLGLPGVIVVMYWMQLKENEKNRKALARERADLLKEIYTERKEASSALDTVLEKYKEDMVEQRQMYRDNAQLVKEYSRLSGDLRAVVAANTSAMTDLTAAVGHNQFCPIVREKGGTE